ncbi:hypothetical protein [Iodobacter sp.]|uniref:hypothetical protein n=1 Tax=Iodobacter sp. TaxID=1915058 RepID=UPI0025F12E90|nr:hypothetical protein [Iodobacter sp.]
MSQKVDKECVQFQADLLQSVREMNAGRAGRSTTVTLSAARNKAGINQAPSKTPMTEAELFARDAQRDIGAELLESIRQMVAGETSPVPLPPSRPLSDDELSQFEAGRDIAAKLEESVRQMLAGEGRLVFPLPESMKDKPIA